MSLCVCNLYVSPFIARSCMFPYSYVYTQLLSASTTQDITFKVNASREPLIVRHILVLVQTQFRLCVIPKYLIGTPFTDMV